MNIKKLIVGSLITAALIGACHTAEVQKTITENTYSDEKENIPTASETLQIKTHSDESEILNDKKSAATSTNSEMPVKDATVNESAIIKSPVELIDHPTKNTSESPVSHETGATIDLPYSTLAIESVKTVYSTSGMGTSVLKIADKISPAYAEGSRLYVDESKAPISTTLSSAEPASSAIVSEALAGQLTAGEINDFQKWNMWEDIASGELEAYRGIWQMKPDGRYSVQVRSHLGNPVIDCAVELVSKTGNVIWKSKSDNTGKAELWDEFDTNLDKNKVDFIRVIHQGNSFKIERPKKFEQGINSLKIRTACDIPETTDILFTVDATGSMGDEIAYLQAELMDVIKRATATHKDVELRLGSVFYRDHGDTYVTIQSQFSENVSTTNDFISQQYADGGGDGPEAVDDAFAVSVDNMSWSNSARARLMFVILDAPPHGEKQFIDKMNYYVKKASEKGIRIVPLVASGGGYDIDKSLEYLMRCCALGTNGTYAFLTNHSGIGESHTAPSTDKYEVETLNKLLLRIIDQFLFVPDCNIEHFVQTENPEDTVSFTTLTSLFLNDSTQLDSANMLIPEQSIFMLKCFPNPAIDYVWVQTNEQVREIFIADNSGKLIERMTPTTTLFQIDLTNYPSGIYFLKAWIDDKWASARIVVTRRS